MRDAFGGFISAYVLNDQALVVLSALQGMLWTSGGWAESPEFDSHK